MAEVDTPQKRRLASQLRLFIGHLQKLGLALFELWIDGSFSTVNPVPMDVDVVCFATRNQLKQMTDENPQQLLSIASKEGRTYAREKWNVDFYLGDFDSLAERNSWKNQFSKD